MNLNIINSTHLVDDACQIIESTAMQAIAQRGRFILSLSGGNTPKPVYEALAKRALPWDKVVITFGDERCVPPDDERSNFHMAREALLSRAPIPEGNILRIRGEGDPRAAAKEYEETLRSHANGGVLHHDLLLLGMGPDGHTASLFPGTPALEEKDRWVIENYVPKFEMWRITFTYPLINASRHVCFLVSRKGKEPVLEEVLSDKGSYPCLGVKPESGDVTWLIAQ